MSKKTLLTKHQKDFLTYFASQQSLVENFYFTGGTALAEYYLQHRKSEDLDFFSLKELSATDLTPLIKKSQKTLQYKTFEYQQIFNRNLFFLKFSKSDQLKLEFTYFPFTQVERPKNINEIKVDSLKDIAVNKLFTIYQRPRGRDFFDLELIMEKTDWTIQELKKLARIKFDSHIDPLMLGKQLSMVKEKLDDPILSSKIHKRNQIIDRFIQEAKRLTNLILI